MYLVTEACGVIAFMKMAPPALLSSGTAFD